MFSALFVRAANTYVSPTGNESTGNGTMGNPWPIKYGVEHTTSGDTCILLPGTYAPTGSIYPPIGVKICGIDTTTTIISVTFTGAPIFEMWSASVTIGGHYIEGITFKGNGVAYNAINIVRRSDVTVNKCAFINFLSGGIYAFDGYDTYANSPAISGINVRNSRFIDCTRYLAAGSYGAIWHRGVENFDITNVVAVANYLPGDSAGFLLKGSRVRNMRITKCDLRVIGHDDGVKWSFAMEYNHTLGGILIDSNYRLQGVMDFAGNFCMKNAYPYSLWIHHNVIGHQSLSARWHDGIYLENYATDASMDMSDVIIEDNLFEYLTRCITYMKVTTGNQSQFERHYIRRNLFKEIGRDASGANGWGVTWGGTGGVFRDINLLNNTFVATNLATRSQLVAINLPVRSSTVDVYRLVNNIFVGFDNSPVMTDGSYPTGTIDSLYMQNNVFYQNGNSNDPKWWGVVPTNIFSSGNLKADPMFTGSFGLQYGSPAIDAGLNVGFPFYGTAKDIGAYEYYFPAVGKRVAKYNNKVARYTNLIGKYE